MKIPNGIIYKSTSDGSPIQGFFRVLQVSMENDQVVVIEIPMSPRKKEGIKQKNYYVKGFIALSYKDMMIWIDKKLIVETKVSFSPTLLMSDKDIREAYPARLGSDESYMIAARDRKFALIDSVLTQTGNQVVIDFMGLDRLVGIRASEIGVSKGQALDALHRYFAFGGISNALLPNMHACGAPNMKRIAKNGKKLGRKNAAAKVGNFELQGKILTDEDRLNLADGWEMYVRPGTTIHDAFLAMSSAFYNKGYVVKHGKYVPDLFDAHLRPTEREFRYHGSLQKDGAAMRRLMGEGEWLKNYRELSGFARSGVIAFGQLGSIDASPIDVNLVSCFDPLCPIGVGRAIVVKDVGFDLIMGWHVAIGGVGADDANLAILNAASNKSEMLKRYGLEDISADDFPSVFFSKILSDNGELRAISGIDANVKKLGGKIEFIPSRRPDMNSSSESGHHSRNRGLNHHLVGTTKGRQAKRGEKLPITQALLSHYQYMRLLISWIHWKNCKQEVPQMLTVEMRRDAVKPTRIEMYRWALQKGYVAGKPIAPDILKAHLLPTFTASVKRNGFILHRPKKDASIELLHGAIFNDHYLAISGLIRSAMNGGKKHIEVKANPDDLSHIYLIDASGIHKINNISNDALLMLEGCISDLGALNDTDRLHAVENASQVDQDEIDVRSFRVEEQAEAMRNKKALMSQIGSSAEVKHDRSSVRKNQASDRKANIDEAVSRASGDYTLPADFKPKINVAEEKYLLNASSTKPAVDNISALLKGKLNKFHDQRGAL